MDPTDVGTHGTPVSNRMKKNTPSDSSMPSPPVASDIAVGYDEHDAMALRIHCPAA